MLDLVFFHHKSHSSWDGIFFYFMQQNDPIPESLVRAHSSSVYQGEKSQNLLYPSESISTTDDVPNSSFSFEFVDHKVFVTEYSLRSLAVLSETKREDFPRCWVLEGSNNNDTWKIIDRQKNTLFQERNQTCTFRVKYPGVYKFIKIMQTSKNSNQSDHFRLSQFELYGAYFENNNFLLRDFFKYFGTVNRTAIIHISVFILLFILI